MTKIKLCGMTRPQDIGAANQLIPDYIGFVFAKKSKRYISFEKAKELREMLYPAISAVGVFVDESPQVVAQALAEGIIDIAQLHGSEDEAYIEELRRLLSEKAVQPRTDGRIIRAFRIKSAQDILAACASSADFVLLDSGAGTGKVFNWGLIRDIGRPYFLAGGLDPENVGEALASLTPYAVDVSSGIETDGWKDPLKMEAFVNKVRNLKECMKHGQE